jgi:hypothetical protein
LELPSTFKVQTQHLSALLLLGHFCTEISNWQLSCGESSFSFYAIHEEIRDHLHGDLPLKIIHPNAVINNDLLISSY